MFLYELSEATAARRRVFLHLVDATDGITAEIGEAAGQPQLSKNGAAFANTTATLTSVGNGLYYVELTAAELDTLGMAAVRFKSAATAEAQVLIQVVAFDPYDSVRLGLTALPNAAAEAAGGLYTRGTGAGQINQDANGRIDSKTVAFSASVIDAASIAPDAIGSSEFAQAAADKIWSSATRSLTDKAGFDLSQAAKDDIIRAASGTADSGTTTTIVDAERTEADTDYWAGSVVLMTSGPNVGQMRRISAFNPTTDTITVANAFTQAVATGNTYLILRSSALEAPGAGATDWTTTEKQHIRHRLGIDGSAAAPTATPSLASSAEAAAIQADTDNIQTRLPAALVSGRIDASVGAMAADVLTAAAIAADAGTEIAAAVWDKALSAHTAAGSFGRALQIIRDGTAQAGAAGSITLDAGASATNDFYNLCTIQIVGGTGAGQSRLISDYTGASKVADIAPNWVTNPDSTSVFVIRPAGRVDLHMWMGSFPNPLQAANVPAHLMAAATDSIGAGAISTDAIGAAEFSQAAADKVWASTTRSLTDKAGFALVTTEHTAIADALLDRNMATGTDSGSATVRTVRQALRVMRNKWTISAGTLTVFKEDDTTTSWTAVTTQTAGNPVTQVDPAS